MEPRTRLRRRCHKRRHLLFFEICFEDVAVVPSILFVEENVAKPSRRVRRGCLALRHHARPRNAAAVPALPRAVRASGRSAGTLPQPRAASRPNGSDARAGVKGPPPGGQAASRLLPGDPRKQSPPPPASGPGRGPQGGPQPVPGEEGGGTDPTASRLPRSARAPCGGQTTCCTPDGRTNRRARARVPPSETRQTKRDGRSA